MNKEDLIKNLNGGIGVELGVAEGEFSEKILSLSNLDYLYSVDMYDGHRGHDIRQYKKAIKKLDKYRNKNSLIRLKFNESLSLFSDEYFDFIYLDGYAHRGYENGREIEDWFKKLKNDGLFIVNNYSLEWPRVVESVSNFKIGKYVKIIEDLNFCYFYKKNIETEEKEEKSMTSNINLSFDTREDLVKSLNGGIGIELGVAEGEFSEKILSLSNLDYLYSIDMYSGDGGHNVDQYKRAIERLYKYKDKNSLIKLKFTDALDLFSDEYFDFIYIDGYAHTGQEDGQTIRDWYKKLKVGGTFAGHDYSNKWPKVIEEVDKFACENNLEIKSTKESKYPSWYCEKKESYKLSVSELIKLSNWPMAVEKDILCDKDDDIKKHIRANSIIDLFKEKVNYKEGEKILDFGCGEGHLSSILKCVGYDIKNYNRKIWDNNKNLLFYDFNKVINNGPYDIIILYDVLDHLIDPIKELKKLKELLTNNGRFFIRCHPWCSRHGGHLYQENNKAFIHLFLENKFENNFKVFNPELEYKKMFDDLNLEIVYDFVLSDPVEDFFENENILKFLFRKFNIDNDVSKLKEIMSISFYDFILRKKI